nr:retrovirus-related Pol polyprotein from transposon TNT 1-94 [Tanacetum cinerariifolium]
MVKTGFFKAIDSLIPLDEHLATFRGYSQNSKAYIIQNKHTRKVKESLNATFDETPLPYKTSPLVDDDLDEEEAIKVTEKKNLENDNMDETLEIDEIVNIKESRNHPLKNVIGYLNQRTLRSQAKNQSNFFYFILTIEPKNVNEALTDDSWIVTVQEELNQFIANNVWELVPQPRNMTIIGIKWVFRNKLDKNIIVSRNKARLVAQGYNQQEGIDYDETYAPVARLESIRILLVYACDLDFKLFQMDVKSAFENDFINEVVYVAQPTGFIDFEKPDHVYKLKKALYGLKQAPKAWKRILKKKTKTRPKTTKPNTEWNRSKKTKSFEAESQKSKVKARDFDKLYKPKIRQSRAKAVVAKVSTSSSTPAVSFEVSELMDMVRALLLDKKNQSSVPASSSTPAPVKAIEPNCVTCGGAHSYQNCPSTSGNVYRDNIQEYVSQSIAANYNQGNTSFRPQMVANQIRPLGFPPHQNHQNSFNRGNNFSQNRGGTEVTKDQVQTPSSQSTAPVQPPVIQSETQTPVSEPVVAPISVSTPNLKPSILYPSRRYNERRRDQANEQIEKFYEIFKDMSFEISFTDALILMLKFTSTLKALIGNKEKLSEMARTPMNEHCSAVILNKLP